MKRHRKILIALDQFVNAVCNGWPDETPIQPGMAVGAGRYAGLATAAH